MSEMQNTTETITTISGADAFVKSLLAEGVDTIFGYPGGANMPIYDALYHYEAEGTIKHVMGRHEQGAIHAAQGYARASGKVGVLLATSGPGATNIITGVADAMMDSTPLVCITGQVAYNLIGTDAFQETDITGISMPVTKWNYQITEADDIAEVLAKAFFIARSGRPGPVLIDITKNAQFQEVEFSYKPCQMINSYIPKPKLDQDKIAQAVEMIKAAEKPFVIWGQGVILSGAEKELESFLDQSNIPSASTLLGLSAIPSDHPTYVGMVGMHGNYAPNMLTNSCDLLIAIGMRFDDRVTGNTQTYAKQAKILHIELDAAEIDKNIATDLAVHADAKEALQALIPAMEKKAYTDWYQEFNELLKEEKAEVIQPECQPEGDGLTMAQVVDQIAETFDRNAIIVSDVGQHQMKAARYSAFKQSRSHITSGGLGTMGFCLPAAIGAKIACPEREVVAIIGDGGYQMTVQELGILLEHPVAVKIVVLNNEFLGMVRQWQELFFDNRYSSTPLKNPNFVKLAEAYGVRASSINQQNQLQDALTDLRDSQEATFLECMVVKQENVFPMIPSGATVTDIRLK
ncbi:biosynthetic-type acetolactate synthase large subunit [Persicobacter diffluens]|uniref:Acetolactate synthase n=1 Tax=Persicobacter diffluens TaxID=981 RepID=A0AAN5AIZ3_9BACT|nr:acetolactate synthase [Persicobacter diffluens]